MKNNIYEGLGNPVLVRLEDGRGFSGELVRENGKVVLSPAYLHINDQLPDSELRRSQNLRGSINELEFDSSEVKYIYSIPTR